MTNCELCGEPMPPNEQMFKYHGYSGGCPKPPITSRPSPAPVQAEPSEARTRLKRVNGEGTRDYRLYLGMEDDVEKVLNALDQQDAEITHWQQLHAIECEVRNEAEAELSRLRAENERKQEYIEELDRREAKFRAQLENLLTPEEAREAFRIYARPSELTPDKRTIYVAKLRRIAGSQP